MSWNQFQTLLQNHLATLRICDYCGEVVFPTQVEEFVKTTGYGPVVGACHDCHEGFLTNEIADGHWPKTSQ